MSGSVKGSRKRSQSGGRVLLRFKFTGFTTCEEADVEQIKVNKEIAIKLGTIDVGVHRASRYGFFGPENQAPLAGIKGALAEKPLKGKALTHSTSGGDPEPSSPPTLMNLIYHDDVQSPIARFVFWYRSKGM